MLAVLAGSGHTSRAQVWHQPSSRISCQRQREPLAQRGGRWWWCSSVRGFRCCDSPWGYIDDPRPRTVRDPPQLTQLLTLALRLQENRTSHLSTAHHALSDLPASQPASQPFALPAIQIAGPPPLGHPSSTHTSPIPTRLASFPRLQPAWYIRLPTPSPAASKESPRTLSLQTHSRFCLSLLFCASSFSSAALSSILSRAQQQASLLRRYCP